MTCWPTTWTLTDGGGVVHQWPATTTDTAKAATAAARIVCTRRMTLVVPMPWYALSRRSDDGLASTSVVAPPMAVCLHDCALVDVENSFFTDCVMRSLSGWLDHERKLPHVVRQREPR